MNNLIKRQLEEFDKETEYFADINELYVDKVKSFLKQALKEAMIKGAKGMKKHLLGTYILPNFTDKGVDKMVKAEHELSQIGKLKIKAKDYIKKLDKNP